MLEEWGLGASTVRKSWALTATSDKSLRVRPDAWAAGPLTLRGPRTARAVFASALHAQDRATRPGRRGGGELECKPGVRPAADCGRKRETAGGAGQGERLWSRAGQLGDKAQAESRAEWGAWPQPPLPRPGGSRPAEAPEGSARAWGAQPRLGLSVAARQIEGSPEAFCTPAGGA